jgi:hypothetical protein
MSSRHRALLSGIERQSHLPSSGDANESGTEDDGMSDQEGAGYFCLKDEDDGEDDDTNQSGDGFHQTICSPEISVALTVGKNRSKNKNMPLSSDDLDLSNFSLAPREDNFLHLNPTGLDIESIFRRKLGHHFESGHRGARQTKGRLRRNQVFGASKEEWPRPVNYVGGGVKMIESASPQWVSPDSYRWFRFEYSDEYARRQREFLILQNTGDMNLLVLFLSVHPSHLDSLLHLGFFFARIGEMDRAADLIRRCLFYHETAYSSTFQPWRAHAHPPCCLSFEVEENQTYFKALFLHFQLAWMRGFLSAAVDLLKLTLSLNPQTDPMHALLLVDKLLLMAGRYEELVQFCQQPASVEFGLPTTPSPSQTPEISHLSDLFPNWSFSLALAHRLQDRRAPDHLKTPHIADNLLLQSVRRFPFLVWRLIDSAALCGSDQCDWKQIQDHKFFRHFSSLDRSSFLSRSDSQCSCSVGSLSVEMALGSSPTWRSALRNHFQSE